jgi:hypothetical protein
MKILLAIISFLFLNSNSFASIFVDTKLDTVNVEIQSDEACPGSIVNFHLINKSSTPLDSIWWKGDYDMSSQNYLFDRSGSATEPNLLNPKWIFSSNNGVGFFPFTLTVKNVLGFTKTYYDTVETGEPLLEIINDPLTCCGFDDTIKLNVRFLTKPYNTCQWIDNTTGMMFPVNGDIFQLVLLTGRSSINLKVVIEDSKGCSGEAIKFFNLTTGISNSDASTFLISPNPTANNLNISGLPENETNDLFIFDLLGKEVYSQKVKGIAEVDLTRLSKGVYFVRVGATTRKVIKN